MKRTHITYLFLFVFFFGMQSLFAQPDPPTNVVAEVGGTEEFFYVQITWDTDTTQNFFHNVMYEVFRKDGAIADEGEFYPIHRMPRLGIFIDHKVNLGQTYTYYVVAKSRGNQSAPSEMAEVTINIADAKAPALISGTILSDENNLPIPGADVRVFSLTSNNTYRIKADAFGNYQASVYPGEYIMMFNARDYIAEFYDDTRLLTEAEIFTLEENDVVDSINASLEKMPVPVFHTLAGTVTDADGNPVRSMIFVYRAQLNAHFKKVYKTMTNTNGEYSLPTIEGDTIVVFARPNVKEFEPEFYEDAVTYEDAKKLAIEGDLTGINFVLGERPDYQNGIAGSVYTEDSSIVDAHIVAIRMQSEVLPVKRHIKYHTILDSLGNYTFENLLPGNYILACRPELGYLPTFWKEDGSITPFWREADTLVVDSTGIVSGFDFYLQSAPDSGLANIAGVIQDGENNPVNGAYVYAYNNAGQVQGYGVTNENGSYTIAGLIPGEYTVTGDNYGYTQDSESNITVDYGSNASQNVDLILKDDTISGVENSHNNVATEYALEQNYPNPFNPSTTIAFTIPMAEQVSLKVYNVLGQEVATLINDFKEAGSYQVSFDASQLTSGVYFYSISAGNFTQIRKMMLLK